MKNASTGSFPVNSLVTIPVGSFVTILPRTWPGINKPGGTGRVTSCTLAEGSDLDDGSPYILAVKYVVPGGFDKDIPSKYCRLFSEMELEKRKVKQRCFWNGEEKVEALEVKNVKKEKRKDEEDKKSSSKATPTKKKEEAKTAKETPPKREETAEAKWVTPISHKKPKLAVESAPSIEILTTKVHNITKTSTVQAVLARGIHQHSNHSTNPIKEDKDIKIKRSENIVDIRDDRVFRFTNRLFLECGLSERTVDEHSKLVGLRGGN